MLNPDVRRHLEGTPVAHLATVLPDGSPQWAQRRSTLLISPHA